VTQPLHVVDIFPTLVKLAGAKEEQKLPLDGRDAWATITSNAPSPNAEILLNATPVNGAIRMGDWKLILDDRPGGAPEEEGEEGGSSARRQARQQAAAAGDGVAADAKVKLYNLAEDPGEHTDMAAKNPEKVKELRAAYDKLAAQAVPPKAKPKDPNFKTPEVWGEH
jgi:arylsulfatase A-like enzyme